MKAQAVPMAAGDAGTQQTIRAMRRLIDEGKKDPIIHELAAQILQRARVPAHDHQGEARAVGEAVYRNVRFTRDVYGKETLHAARDIVRLRIGDCDDFTILICALLGTIGHKTRIVTVSNHPEDPSQFSHVYPETCVNGRWIPVDYARRAPSFGKGPERYFRRREWSTSSDDYVDIEGLNGQRSMGYDPTRLPLAYRANVNEAIRQGLRRRPRPPQGMGSYGVPGLRRGLGVDWSSIASAIQAGTTGAANIITAERAAPQNLFPTTAIGQPQASPFGYPQTYPVSSFGGISTSTLLLGGLGILAVVLVAGRGR
jgi:hypothetical protein